MGSWGREDKGKAVAGGLGKRVGSWQSGWSHICVQINLEEQLGGETDHATQGSSVGK